MNQQDFSEILKFTFSLNVTGSNTVRSSHYPVIIELLSKL
jgi:hypothetical protein